jgi:hypothetical protein
LYHKAETISPDREKDIPFPFFTVFAEGKTRMDKEFYMHEYCSLSSLSRFSGMKDARAEGFPGQSGQRPCRMIPGKAQKTSEKFMKSWLTRGVFELHAITFS